MLFQIERHFCGKSHVPLLSNSFILVFSQRVIMASRSVSFVLPCELFLFLPLSLLLLSSHRYHGYRICVVALVFLLSPRFFRLLYLCLLLEQFEILEYGLSHVTYCHTSHTVTRHILSHVTYCRTSHTVARHTLSHVTHCRTSQIVARHTLSHVTYCRTPYTIPCRFLVLKQHEYHRNWSSEHQAAVSYPDQHTNPNREEHPNNSANTQLKPHNKHIVSLLQTPVF